MTNITNKTMNLIRIMFNNKNYSAEHAYSQYFVPPLPASPSAARPWSRGLLKLPRVY